MTATATLELDAHDQSAQVVLRQETPEPSLSVVADGQASLISARAPDKVTPNEDAVAVIPVDDNCGVLVVADGLGGERAGHEASALAVRTLAESVLVVRNDPTQLRTAILDGIEAANRLILEMGIGAATTIAVVEINDRHIRPYHVGDSMILVVGGMGKVKLQTVSHSPVAMAVESGLLNELEAMHHDERHVVSNVVGSAGMRIEIGPRLKLAPRDTVLLASDGLSDNLHQSEIVERIRKGKLRRSTELLVVAADERMRIPQVGLPHKPDDLTVIVYRRRRIRSR